MSNKSLKKSRMIAQQVKSDARFALDRLGGNRLHPRYAPVASEAMMESVRLQRPTVAEFVDVHAIASEQIGGALATLEEIRRVDALTDAAIWVVRRKGVVTGFLAPLALTALGRDALVDGTFRAGAIQQEWVARMGQPLAGFYCWSYAGRDQVTRGALVLALRTLIDTHFPDLPFFGRDTTAAGGRIMAHLGFSPFDDVEHLYWRCRSVMASEEDAPPARPGLSPLPNSITPPNTPLGQDAAR
jgi:hypothetical protein